MNVLRRVLNALSLALALAPLGAIAEVVVIGHPAIAVASISQDEAAHLWLGKSRKLADGMRVTIVIQDENHAVSRAFNGKILGKDPKQFKAYWSKLVFTGKATPPLMLDNDAAVRDWVAKTPGALGYVDAASTDGSVKILLRIE